MASSVCKIILTTATFAALSVILTVDAQSFTRPVPSINNVPLYGNLSGNVDFEFIYTVPDNNKIGFLICGYGNNINIVVKRKTQAASIQGGYVGRAEVFADITGSSLTIRLKNLNFNDAKLVCCLLVYDALPYFSGKYKLNIYERPRFIGCLDAGIVNIQSSNVFTLNEGQTLNSTCVSYGNPVPFLQCSLLNKDGFVDNGATTSSERKNYTAQPMQRLLFYNVRRTATKVRCVADSGIHTGKVTVQKNLVVDYAPEAPEKVETIERSYHFIRFKWIAPKDSGNSKIFVYYLTATHPNGTITGRNYSTPTTNPLLEYTFVGLQRDSTYPIGVSGYNSVGQGKVKTATIRTVPFKAPVPGSRSAPLSTPSIVGIVFGVSIGIVIIVIIVITVFFVLKKKQGAARYPQAFVNEAVHYPPGDTAMNFQSAKEARSQPL